MPINGENEQKRAKILLNKQKRQMVVENMLKLVPYMTKTIRAAENIMNSNQKAKEYEK